MEIILPIVAIFILSLILVKSSDSVISATRALSHMAGIGSFTIAALFLALATSFPELFVGITAALSNESSLSFGNVLGANITNLGLILGIAAVIGGGIRIQNTRLVDKDTLFTLIAGALPILLLWDRTLSRVDGLILLVTYGIYAAGLFHERFLEVGRVHHNETSWKKMIREIETGRGKVREEVVHLFFWLAVLLVSADVIVGLSVNLAGKLGVPIFLVGLLVVSLGTTLPELIFSIRSVATKSTSLLLGNLLGSVIVNSTLIVGVVALLSPFSVPSRRVYLPALVAFFVLIVLFWIFTRSENKLGRVEGVLLLLGYLAFVAFETIGTGLF